MDPFHAYDIRGRVPKDINNEFSYKLGLSVAEVLKPTSFVIGWDARTTSEDLAEKLIEGLRSRGVSVLSIGLVNTPEFYYSLLSTYADGGIMVTASHNPRDFNGFKICETKGKPIFKENKLEEIKKVFYEDNFQENNTGKGKLLQENAREKYREYFLKYKTKLEKTYRILIDTGNGMGIHDVELLNDIFGDSIVTETLFEDINGSFPFHQPDPTVLKNTEVIRRRLEDQQNSWDFGCAFDGDGDRIVFFLPDGKMIPPDLITGLLGGFIANKHELVGYEVRTSRRVGEYLEEKNINVRRYPAGSAYMKQLGSKDNAVFLGEKSGHYMYKTLKYTDSPLLTIISILNLLDKTKKTLRELIKPLDVYVQSGEINFPVIDSEKALKKIDDEFSSLGEEFRVEHIDGISVYGKDFFFNIRKSNTEELLRLNIESESEEVNNIVREKVERIINSRDQ